LVPVKLTSGLLLSRFRAISYQPHLMPSSHAPSLMSLHRLRVFSEMSASADVCARLRCHHVFHGRSHNSNLPERPPSDPRTMYSTRTGMRTRRRCFHTESRDLVMGCTCTLQAHCSSLQISVALHREVRELPRALSDAMPCCELYGRCCVKRLWLC